MSVIMKTNHENDEKRCGGCTHLFSSHDIKVNTKTSKVKGKCKVCGCNGISDG